MNEFYQFLILIGYSSNTNNTTSSGYPGSAEDYRNDVQLLLGKGTIINDVDHGNDLILNAMVGATRNQISALRKFNDYITQLRPRKFPYTV